MHRRQTSKEKQASVPPSSPPMSGTPASPVTAIPGASRLPQDPSTPPQTNGSPRRMSFPAHGVSHSRSVPQALSTSTPNGGGLMPPSPLGLGAPPAPSTPVTTSSPITAQGDRRHSVGAHSHGHSRIHSRNLSMYFPRPGQTVPPIAEDTPAQALDAPVTLMPSSTPPASRSAFRFPLTASASRESELVTPPTSSRRGHHHKHSLSHNFFSFMEPGVHPSAVPSTPQSASFLSPSQSPETPWVPISPFPGSASMPSLAQSASSMSLLPSSSSQPINTTSISPAPPPPRSLLGSILHLSPSLRTSLVFTICQFTLGASLWVSGQQRSSLACTGLGYWIVFDASGVALRVLRGLRDSERTLRKPFGTQREETLALFAQSVYLIFASVYVCKETVEHVILSAGEANVTAGGSGHHHSHVEEDDVAGLGYPDFLIVASLLFTLISNFLYHNHAKLVDAIGYRFPTPYSFLKPDSVGGSALELAAAPLLSNPFALAPIAFAALLLFASVLLEPEHQPVFDLLLAAVETVLTFAIAYPAAVALGSVLMQTAPDGGKGMEGWKRALRSLEHHPLVVHVPAPHVWQLTPAASVSSTSHEKRDDYALVATVEVHVKASAGDDEVLKLTKWAWEVCEEALGGEVTVGVVREDG